MTFCRCRALATSLGVRPRALQRMLVEIGHDDARLAAVGIGNFGPMHDRKIGTDDVLAEIVERWSRAATGSKG